MIKIKEGLNHITAQFCAACRIKCRKVQIYSLKRFAVGKTGYWPVVLACRDAGMACESMADLCFQMNPLVAQLLRECARKCDACAGECANVADPRLADLANTAREAARACRCLSWTYWQSFRRNLRPAAKPAAPAAKGRRGEKKLARPFARNEKRRPAEHRDAG